MALPDVWVTLKDIRSEHVSVRSTWGDPDHVYVYLSSLVQWRDKPEDIRSVLAEIDRQLPATSRVEQDALLARWQDRKPAEGEVVDSLRLVTSAHFVPGPRSERSRPRVLRRIADCRTLATGAVQ